MHTRLARIDQAWVEAQDHVRSAIVEVADLIDFVFDLERLPEERRQWIPGSTTSIATD
jgi:hypothetical protein